MLTDVNILLEGETGTGKDLLACQILALSRRAEEPFVVINIPAIPDSILELVLFAPCVSQCGTS